MMAGREHSPELGALQTVSALVRVNSWAFGWPVSVILAASSAFLHHRSTAQARFRSVVLLMLFALSAVQLGFYFFLAFGSVHDFGSAYHVWHVPWLALMLCFAIRSLMDPRDAEPLEAGALRGRRALQFASALTLVGLGMFWPYQVERWRATADVVLAPVQAAEAAAHGKKAIVMWRSIKPRGALNWVYGPPSSFPESQLWWAKEGTTTAAVLRRLYPDRLLLRLDFVGSQARVLPVR
jgi:hypothetical protein